MPLDLVDNLLAKERAGEWTRGEGLVATLSYLAGEIAGNEVSGSMQRVDDDATGLLWLADEYVESGSDATGAVSSLLNKLALTPEELDQISEPETSTGRARGLLVYEGSLLAQLQEEQNYCMEVFQTSQCLVRDLSADLEAKWPGKYVLYRPNGELNSGWDAKHFDWTHEAMLRSATVFEPLGVMPPTAIVLHQYQHFSVHLHPSGGCLINLPVTKQADPKVVYQQVVALWLAQCLLLNTVGDEAPKQTWWFYGSAIYLSGVAYPEANGEWVFAPHLVAIELDAGLFSRRGVNWILFEDLHPELSPNGIIGLLVGLPHRTPIFVR